MAQLVINIPDDKIDLVLTAFAEQRGIEATSTAFKAEIIGEIRQTVRHYQARRYEGLLPPVELT